MDKYLEWFKAHPLETGGIIIVILGAVYLYMSSSSSSAAASPTDSAAADYYNAQLQAQQLAGSNAQAALASQTQEYTTGLQATVQNNETAAQLAAIQDQDSSAVQTAQIQANANTAITQVQANVAVDQIGAQQDETDQETAASLSEAMGAYGVQNNQISAQTQQQQIAANVANETTQAQVTENQNNLASVLGLVTAQDQMTESENSDQLDALENNNSTSVTLSGQQYGYLNNELDDATAVNLTQLGDATTLETQAQQNQLNLYNEIIPLAGQQKNSALDATDQTSLFQTILAGGNAGVAAAGDSVSGTSAVSGNNQAAGIINAVSKPISSIVSGLFA